MKLPLNSSHLLASAITLVLLLFSSSTAQEAATVSPSTLVALKNIPTDSKAFSTASKELRPHYLNVAHPLIRSIMGDKWHAKGFPSRGRQYKNNRALPGTHWAFSEHWIGGDWVQSKETGRRKEITLSASIDYKAGKIENLERYFRIGKAKSKYQYDIRPIKFHGMRAVHATRAGGVQQYIRWQRGDHNISVSVANVKRNINVRELAEKVHAAAVKSGWYDFPNSLLESKTKVVNIEALDANPQFYGEGKVMPEHLKPTQLILGKTTRKGTSADGVSQLVIRAEVNTATPVVFTLKEGSRGKLSPLFKGKTLTLDKKHYAFALYTPPKRFGGGHSKTPPNSMVSSAAKPRQRLGKILEVEDLIISATPYDIDTEGKGTPIIAGRKDASLKLARPPLVLVHGLFSNPVDCWVKTKATGASLVVLLETQGFLPFLVNYQKSNGTETLGDSWLNGERKNARTSGFHANRRVVWDSPDPFDYRPQTEGWFVQKKPNLPPFQNPDKIRIGGIKQALKYYRDTLNIAATQADAIGHSMGGILSRVWASPNYNPTYKREENFNKGDIRRLVTLNTPHHGSELTELKDAIEKGEIKGEGWLAWARRSLAKQPLWWYTESDAIRDLRPGSRALKRIGPTPLPSYAMTTWAEDNVLGNNDFDEKNMYLNLYSVAGIMFFNNSALLDDFVHSRFLRWRNTADPFKKTTDFEGNAVPQFSHDHAQYEYAHIFRTNMDHSVYYWASRREQAYRDELTALAKKTITIPFGILSSDMGGDEMDLFMATAKSSLSNAIIGGDATRIPDLNKEQDAPTEFMAQLRALVFHNDHMNDGAVRVVSQQGGLVSAEPISGVLHSFSPWDYKVQRELLLLLKWGDKKFSEKGFGPAGQLTNRYLPSSRFKNDRIHGERAIKWSGYVPSHAREYGKVADRKHVIILGRPVNHDSTKLIADGAATKAMAVKGKSASWGPQRGFIPVNQRFSKLWRVNASDPVLRENNIKKFSDVTQKMLKKEHPIQKGKYYAEGVPLVVTVANQKYDVLYHPDANDLAKKADADEAIVLHQDGKFYDWRNDGGKKFNRNTPPKELSPQPNAELAAAYKSTPMEVLADGLSTENPKPYLTADYDLLAIAYHRDDGFQGPPKEVTEAKFHPIYGAVSQKQIDLIKELNKACEKGAGYKSGNLTHHGPENQYSGSPYIDYPILVFDPGTKKPGDQKIFIIRQGPVGFRDIHLKRYFTEKIRQGFNLWSNPNGRGWLWRKSSTFATTKSYDPRDHEKLDKYIDEAPEPVAPNTVASNNRPTGPKPKSSTPRREKEPNSGKMKENPEPDTSTSKADGPKEKETGAEKPASMPPQKVSQYARMQTKKIRHLANRGNTAAMNEMGYRYSTGEGVTKDLTVAMQWLTMSAERGDKNAPLMIARHYISKNNPDPIQALHWYHKAASSGHAEGHTGIGYIYLNGIGTPRNYKKAMQHYHKAASLGDTYALNNLGSCYLEGTGVKKDAQKGVLYYEKSAALGNQLAHRNLAYLYKHGIGVKKNLPKAATWYEKSARLGDIKAANLLGILYEQGGEGLTKDLSKAFTYYQQAARGGNIYAQRNVGVYLMVGQGTPKNKIEAYAWLHLSANRGFLKAGRERDALETTMRESDVRQALKKSQKLASEIKWRQ